jgi:hypothetical protein
MHISLVWTGTISWTASQTKITLKKNVDQKGGDSRKIALLVGWVVSSGVLEGTKA